MFRADPVGYYGNKKTAADVTKMFRDKKKQMATVRGRLGHYANLADFPTGPEYIEDLGAGQSSLVCRLWCRFGTLIRFNTTSHLTK